MSALPISQTNVSCQPRAVASASRPTALSDAPYRNGLVSQLELLEAQRSELRNLREALQVRSAQYRPRWDLCGRWVEAGTHEEIG
jgi:multidrug efflux system outer membrane protein